MLRQLSYGHRQSEWAGGNAPPSPGGRVCPRGGASRPAGPSLVQLFVQRRPPPLPWVPERKSPRPAVARAGRSESLPSEVPASRALTRRLRDLPRCNVHDPDRIDRCPSPLHHARSSGCPAQWWTTGAPRPRRDGHRRPARFPTAGPGSGCWRDSEVGAFESGYPVNRFNAGLHTQVPENKKSRLRCLLRARCAARRLPSRRGEGGARMTSGRDSRGEECKRGSAGCQPPLHKGSRMRSGALGTGPTRWSVSPAVETAAGTAQSPPPRTRTRMLSASPIHRASRGSRRGIHPPVVRRRHGTAGPHPPPPPPRAGEGEKPVREGGLPAVVAAVSTAGSGPAPPFRRPGTCAYPHGP